MNEPYRLLDIVTRVPNPIPWSEGDNIPWNEPGFSERMLSEHLSQEHDAASRREYIIDQQVSWIHNTLIPKSKAYILDLGCGPGLYAVRLARLGHICTGIDFSPASIRYARQMSAQEHLSCTFYDQDLRQADFGVNHDLAMLIFGELNVFSRDDAALILRKIAQSLHPEGILLLEVHTHEAVEAIGRKSSSWFSASSSLFSPRPHLCLVENTWNDELSTSTIRYYVIDASSAEVVRFAQSLQAYTEQDYRNLLEGCGFQQANFHPSLTGESSPDSSDFMVITASPKKSVRR